MNGESATITLYRPTGDNELALIRASGFAAFPPRLPEQPIFYPVLSEEYAAQIARDWNARRCAGSSNASRELIFISPDVPMGCGTVRCCV